MFDPYYEEDLPFKGSDKSPVVNSEHKFNCWFIEEPLKKQLKQELGIDIRCFEVWYDTTNLELLQKLDRGRCGGVPFFYNKRTRRFICGATTYCDPGTRANCSHR